MSLHYLVPCSCGKDIPVETKQAGEVIVCSCGAKVEVPRLLSLQQLDTLEQTEPQVDTSPTRKEIEMQRVPPVSIFGRRPGLSLLIVLAAIAFAYLGKSTDPNSVIPDLCMIVIASVIIVNTAAWFRNK